MKILVISNMYPSRLFPNRGIYVKRMIEILKKSNFQIIEIVLVPNGDSVVSKLLSYSNFFIKAARAIKKETYDCIYVHYLNHSLIPLILKRKSIKGKVILNAHGGDITPYGFFNRLLSKFTIKYIRNADLLVFPSTFLANYYFEKTNVTQNHLVYPSGGIDTNFLKPRERSHGDGSLSIGFYGRIEDGKGWDVFIDSAFLFQKQHNTPLKVYCAGYGREMNKMRHKINEMQLQQVVIQEDIAYEDLPGFFANINLLIFSTKRQESLGLVALEAMSCGVPVVGSKLGAIPKYIEEGKNGYLVNSNDSREVVKKVLCYSKLPEEGKKEMSSYARETALNYDTGKTKDTLINAFKDLI